MILLASAVLSAAAVAAVDPKALWNAWPERRFVQAPAGCLRPADLMAALQALAAKHPGRARVEQAGRSAEGRPIHLLAVGTGERRVLLWSQMHGDEPSATPALLDLADHLLSAPEGRRVLDALTLLMVPMLNPDGTERVARRNAQGIDVNRDALNLATPEGRLLKQVRDRWQPILGFNLHDQDRRTTIGETGRLATISLLAVAGDAQGTVTEGRRRAKRAASAIVGALTPLIGASIARYDEDWSPRAFGDNITAWGTPVVLVESGGYAGPLSDLTRLNFVALASVLTSLAADDLAGHDPALYEALTRNREDAFADVVVRGGRILQGAGGPYRADLAFDVELAGAGAWHPCPRPTRRAAAGAAPGSTWRYEDPVSPWRAGRRPVGGVGESEAPWLIAAPHPDVAGREPDPPWRDVPPHLDEAGPSRIIEVGDARFLAAGREVDASGTLIVPAFTASVRGLGARRWLTAAALDDMARLGVGVLRWHVRMADVGAAQAAAGERAAPGRPAIRVVAAADTPSLLLLSRPPRRPASRALADVLDALGTWRAPKRSFEATLPLLVAPPEPGPPTVRLSRDQPASFLVLRPASDTALDAATLRLDTVYVDGRERP